MDEELFKSFPSSGPTSNSHNGASCGETAIKLYNQSYHSTLRPKETVRLSQSGKYSGEGVSTKTEEESSRVSGKIKLVGFQPS